MKKILSVLLALVVMFTMCVPAFAADEPAVASNDGEPIVVVRGIDFAGLVREDGSKALSFQVMDIINLLPSIVLRRMKGEDDALINSLLEYAVELFEPLSCDKEGNPRYSDVHIPKFYEPAAKLDLSGDQWADTAVGLFRSIGKKFGGEDTYLYTFDWRKSPKELAAELNDFINMVKTNTGSDKVDLAACSMGGMITTAYMNYYGTGSLDSVTYLSSAHNGGHVVGSAFTGDLVLNADSLGKFLVEKTNGNIFVRMLNAMGIVKSLAKYLNKVITQHKDKIYDDFLRVSLGTAYGLWALIPDAKFDEAVDFFYGDCKDEYSVALGEIAEVRDFVFSTEEIIADAYNAGVKITFVSHYNSKQLPIYSGYQAHGDGVLESERTSGFGTFANYGSTLSDEQLQGVDAKYISPDKAVNASTCLYPNTTWIVRNAKHVGCKDGSDHTEFAIWLITRDDQVTVNTNADYPQFLNCDGNENFVPF